MTQFVLKSSKRKGLYDKVLMNRTQKTKHIIRNKKFFYNNSTQI